MASSLWCWHGFHIPKRFKSKSTNCWLFVSSQNDKKYKWCDNINGGKNDKCNDRYFHRIWQLHPLPSYVRAFLWSLAVWYRNVDRIRLVWGLVDLDQLFICTMYVIWIFSDKNGSVSVDFVFWVVLVCIVVFSSCVLCFGGYLSFFFRPSVIFL